MTDQEREGWKARLQAADETFESACNELRLVKRRLAALEASASCGCLCIYCRQCMNKDPAQRELEARAVEQP